MSIRKKIFIPMIGLAVACSAIVLILSILLYSRDLTQAQNEKIDAALRSASSEIERLKSNSRLAAMSVANSPDLIDAITSGDRDRIEAAAHNLRDVAQVDFCTVIAPDGTVLAKTHQSGYSNGTITHKKHLHSALNGIPSTSIIQGDSIPLGLTTRSPIFGREGNVIGVVSFGYMLDNMELIEKIKEITGCEIAVFTGGTYIASTLTDGGGEYVFGENMLFRGIPLSDKDGGEIGILLAGSPKGLNSGRIAFFILNGVLLTLIVTAVSVIIAFLLTNIVERRLKFSIDAMNTAIEEKNAMVYLESILNGLDMMIYVTDPKTDEIIFINENMKNHYNIKGDVVGKKCYKVLQENQNTRCLFCPCHRLDKNSDEVVVWEEESSLTNRSYRNTDKYIKWPDGKTLHMQHSVDMTDLIDAKVSAEQHSFAKGIFLANMSHEIRTPLNAMLGISELSLRNGAISREARESFEKISDSGHLLLSIINDILDFSKIESGKMDILPDRYDLPSLISDTVQVNRLRSDCELVQFVLNVDKNTPLELYGDELRIRQILNNLLSNAFKYTEKGRVSLDVSAKADGNDFTLIFKVSDTGQGMSGGQIERMFDEYSRFNVKANRSISGTGLGMSITKRLVDLMGGGIQVDSRPGKGSSFTVSLPQKRAGAEVCGAELAEKLRSDDFSPPAQKEAQAVYEHMPYGSVLVVDDIESNLFVATGMLAPYGLRIESVKSGAEAVRLVEAGKEYDIIFMDYMMPQMDGVKAVELIRAEGYTLPIVALTANAVTGQEEMFLSNGFDGFISKPIDWRELDQYLIDFIRDKQPPEVLEAAQREKLGPAPPQYADSELHRYFIIDAKAAIKVLEKTGAKLNSLTDEELNEFTIAVHGIKNALANIGEIDLSDTALKLEREADAKNIAAISERIPGFIDSLTEIAERLKPAEDDGEEVSEMAELQESLLRIKDYCLAIDKKAVQAAIEGLMEKRWPGHIRELLDELSVLILHSAFKKAAGLAERMAKEL
jgi:signal transduction histidine kinase/DNA-binding NarL/FixJ family response regulator